MVESVVVFQVERLDVGMVYMTEVHTIIDVDIPLRRKQHPFIGQLHDGATHRPSSAVMRENSSFETSAAMFAGTDRNINKVTITVRIIVNVVSFLKVFCKTRQR
jgi:hypothetical protein